MCGCFLCAPQLGTWPATQVYALSRNKTSDPLVCRPALNLSQVGTGNQVLGDGDKELNRTHRAYNRERGSRPAPRRD